MDFFFPSVWIVKKRQFSVQEEKNSFFVLKNCCSVSEQIIRARKTQKVDTIYMLYKMKS